MAANFIPVKKPRPYEISPKKILIFQALNLIVGISAAVSSYILKDPENLICYFLVLFVILILQLGRYDYVEDGKDISTVMFHPDLMNENEYISLKKRLTRLVWKKSNLKEDGKPFPEKYQTLYNNLKSIYDSQVDLRRRCWFTKLVGVPVVDKNNAEHCWDFRSTFLNVYRHFSLLLTGRSLIAEEPIPSGDNNTIVEEKPAKTDQSNSDSDSETDTASTDDNSDSEFDSDDNSESEIFSTDDKDSEFESDDGSDVSAESENDSYNDDTKMMKFIEKISEEQSKIDQLKLQFAEMKAENSKLKNFVENFITSQACA